MPSQKGRPAPSLHAVLTEMRSHGVILEDIRSQNRATIEAVEATRAALEERIDRGDRDSQARDSVLEAAIGDLRKTVEQNSVDIRSLNARVEALAPLDQRISALEQRSSQ
jgi:hypothetical protein